MNARTTGVLAAAGLVFGLAGVSGCSTARSVFGASPRRTVALEDFAQREGVADEAEPVAADATRVRVAPDTPDETLPTAETVRVEGDRIPVEIVQAPPAWNFTESGRPVIIDSLVGQVNGRPIFAHDFFEPIEDELMAAASRLQGAEFIQAADSIIAGHLRQVVLDELFLAEAESGLTQQQQVGLRYLLGEIREEMVQGIGGSETTADERFAASGEGGLDEAVEERRRQELIAAVVRDKIWRRIIVSWRDVEREYDRRATEFNPPATVTLSRIRLSRTRDAERIAEVDRRLGAGESFADITAGLGIADGGRWLTSPMGPGGLAEITDLASEPIQAAVADLEVGETTEALDLGNFAWWVNVTSIDGGTPRTIYDVQRQLIEELTAQRAAEEQSEYIASLFEEGMYDELNEMAQRLSVIAYVRYAR